MNILTLKSFKVGNQEPMTLMGGVNVLESELVTMTVAEKFAEATTKLNINWVFKGSFDKANRSSTFSFRGPGLEEGLKILEKVKGGLIRSDYTIAEGFGEVIEAEILSNSSFINKNIGEVELPKSIRVGAILRKKEIIIPNSETIFKENDDVVFFAESKSIKTLEKLLSVK